MIVYIINIMFMLFQRVVVAIATNVRENKNGEYSEPKIFITTVEVLLVEKINRESSFYLGPTVLRILV